jgi:plasmid stabilization system protein ParE
VNLKFTWSALNDLRRLHDFVATKNLQAASSTVTSLRKSINHLKDHPDMGIAIDEGGVRTWIAGEYVLHYQINEELLLILRIWHGRESRSS